MTKKETSIAEAAEGTVIDDLALAGGYGFDEILDEETAREKQGVDVVLGGEDFYILKLVDGERKRFQWRLRAVPMTNEEAQVLRKKRESDWKRENPRKAEELMSLFGGLPAIQSQVITCRVFLDHCVNEIECAWKRDGKLVYINTFDITRSAEKRKALHKAKMTLRQIVDFDPRFREQLIRAAAQVIEHRDRDLEEAEALGED